MKSYDHQKIEKKWRDVWEKTKIYTTPDEAPGPAAAEAKAGKKDNFYLLTEFPYPSGNLHVGHWYAFSVPDILARALRMQGKNVMYPMGFDAFGLPAENAAIKNKLNPRTWTYGNIEYMKKQIRSMGASFDWSREVVTCDPEYYKWTQWLFLQLYRRGLVYQKETAVNWCPKDKTVLANEQVVNGLCERCDTPVEQRMMLQWNIKITEYADRLIDDLEALDWPEQIKESQRNWIGRSEGAEILFPLEFNDTNKKYKYVLLHGFRGAPSDLSWIAEKLRSFGHEVIVPELPTPESPNETAWVVAAKEATTYDENTILFGYSLGAATALKVVEKLDTKIARLVLAGGFIDPKFADNPRNFQDKFVWEFDAARILSKVAHLHFLQDTTDTAVSKEQAERLGRHFGVPITYVQAEKPHFEGEREIVLLNYLTASIVVFTTRPDTLFGATYLVLAPEHPWVTLALQHKTVLKNNDEVEAYVKQAGRKSELERMTDQKEKTGVKLEGVDAVNPATGEKIPLYVADYVLANYGTGAIMAVPAHDERDHDFAVKYRLPIRQTVLPVFGSENKRDDAVRRRTINAVVRNDEGKILFLKWKEYKWLTNVIGGIEEGETAEEAAVREVLEETGYRARALFVSPIAIESHYYAEHKKEWRARLDRPVLLELESDQKGPLSEEEREKHDTCWMTPEEAAKTGLFKNNLLALDLALGRVRAYTEPRYGEEQGLTNSGSYDGLPVTEGKRALTESVGRAKKTYKLRDWIVSRQRYWGVPIPVIHCEKCGANPVPDEQLPVLLPDVEDYLPTGDGKSPLAKVDSFVNVACPACGGPARRETDTLDTFVDSSWYFLRYTDPKNSNEFAARPKQATWMPVDLYSGGAEHTTMHLLYSRFWHKALYDCGLVGEPEPYKRRMNRSLILGPDGQKMSKSRGNVIDPDEVVGRLGADTVRMYLAFIGPYNEVANYPWNPDGVVGVRRFLERVWKLQEHVDPQSKQISPHINHLMHLTIMKVGQDIANLKFNTAISQMMILLNNIEKIQITPALYRDFLRLLAPFAPHVTEELWYELGEETSIHTQPWPAYDQEALVLSEYIYAIQINGKTRGEVSVSADADSDEIKMAAQAAIAQRIEGQEIAKVIIVPKRVINFVLRKP